MAPTISNTAMLFLIIFVLIPVSLSYMYSLGLGKSITWASVRGVIQLLLIGYILTYLFELPPSIGISFMLFVMISIASFHASKKGEGITNVRIMIFLIILGVELLILSMWLGFGMISFTSEQVIPMSGMVIGNSMVAIGLALERMKNEFREGKGKIVAALSLGAKPQQATKIIVRKIVRAAMIPNVDGLKTVGLVQLPGMMTGLILGGVAPIDAIRYQIVISLSIFICVSISAMLVTMLLYRYFFNENMQLIDM
ncbi:iron export ABC transporter permease subunit FetB [Anaerobacillus alkalidiazotrophicus]|uniref:Iron export ABC transporter permease subunit FetB n=1 Tax=Anaerobacillus alkalidiazotrophicus TaxID=472963 RepID=A0A1S2M6C1_9BACI|nr:iron export ABC transporter permease subunit FetB [Anaerobacillus alkalidiazotrophicus]OIJ20269.1 iron export ABC transporter permease subunit FetB [Anaerobacillus alkalidiazotrophicus]